MLPNTEVSFINFMKMGSATGLNIS